MFGPPTGYGGPYDGFMGPGGPGGHMMGPRGPVMMGPGGQMMGPEGMGPGKLSPNLTIVLLRLAFDQTTVPQNDKTITKLNIILFF